MPDQNAIEPGLLTGAMISAPAGMAGSPRFRRVFSLERGRDEVTCATLYLSALGVIEGWLNGAPVHDELLTPGWTAYEWRIGCTMIDVAPMLRDGENVLGLQLGDGWYATPLFVEPHARYGEFPCAFAELRIVYADGSKQVIATDGSWQAGEGPVLASSLYDGQTIDARLAGTAWVEPGDAAGSWREPRVMPFDHALLQIRSGPPVCRQEVLAPIDIRHSPTGRILVDFGQNIVGWARVRVSGERGQQIVLRHAEVLEDGELGTRPLRSAKATDTYILSGGADQFEPTLVFHGFRYLEIENWPGGLDRLCNEGGIEAVVVGSDLRRIGHFRCSDTRLNQFHSNVVWSTKGNFLAIPTDCPQRDERLGWTGDIAVFAPTAAFLFDVKDFLREWLRDLMLEQAHAGGVVPWVVPNVLKYLPSGMLESSPDFIDRDGQRRLRGPEPVAIWSDAVVWVPHALWAAYGDRAVLEETFDAQLAHVERALSLRSQRGVWECSFQFGDWLDPDAPADRPILAKADEDVVATLCLYRSLNMVAQAAAILGREEASKIERAAAEVRQAFGRCYVDDGTIRSDCPTVYALAICFDILDTGDHAFAGSRLAELVRASGHRISTGFAGTPFICDALSRAGHWDDAYKLLLQTKEPSWLNPVELGATTIWERYDSMLPDGSINPGSMTSFNHYALGSVADWMHRNIGGIQVISASENYYRLAPRPGGNIRWAEASLETHTGILSCAWKCDADTLTIKAMIPPGASVELEIFGHSPIDLAAGMQTHRFSQGARG